MEKKIQTLLNTQMKSAISESPLSVTELAKSLEFANLYQLDEFKMSLNQVKLAFDENNPIEFWDLADKFDMRKLKRQALNRLKTVPAKKEWPVDVLLGVIGCLKKDKLRSGYCDNVGQFEIIDFKESPKFNDLERLTKARKAHF